MISSYDRDAPRPVPGTIWAWEPEKPHAAELVRVTDCRWIGEEWFVATVRVRERAFPPWPLDDLRVWNDLSRFWEACHYVQRFPGVPGRKGVTRRGEPRADEVDRVASTS